MNQKQIIKAVQNRKLFGMVECDIHVPHELYDYFSEMSPIFKNIDVPFEEIGSHMKEFVEKYNLSKTPRRSLIGSMHGEKMLFATPLLKWYLDKGLKITRVYECIEYLPVRCFRSFVQKVCDATRLGDTDPDKSIIADTS